MRTSPEKKGPFAMQVARMGLPPLQSDDGLVELSIQEHKAKVRHVVENYPADRIPKVGADIQFPDLDIPSTFVITEVKHLLVPRATKTIRAVLLLVRKVHDV